MCVCVLSRVSLIMALPLKGHWGCGSCARQSGPGHPTLPQSWEEEEARKTWKAGRRDVKQQTKNKEGKKKRKSGVSATSDAKDFLYMYISINTHKLSWEYTPHELIVLGQTLWSTGSSSLDLKGDKKYEGSQRQRLHYYQHLIFGRQLTVIFTVKWSFGCFFDKSRTVLCKMSKIMTTTPQIVC